MAFKVDMKDVLKKAEAVREQETRRQSKSSGGDKNDLNFYDLRRVGDHIIRILPAGPDNDTCFIPSVQDNIFAMPVWTHGNIPGSVDKARCIAKTFPDRGSSCPICEATREYWDWVNKSGIPQEMATKQLGGMYLSGRAYTNCLDLNSKDTSEVVYNGKTVTIPKIFVIGMPIASVYNKLVTLWANEDFGDFTDPETGYNIFLQVSKRPGTTWPDYQVNVVPKQRPIHNDPEVRAAIIANMVNIGSVFKFPEKAAYDNIVAAAANIRMIIGNRPTAVSHEDTPSARPSSFDNGGDSVVRNPLSKSKPGCYRHHSLTRDLCGMCPWEDSCRIETKKLNPTEEDKVAWYKKMAENPSLVYTD